MFEPAPANAASMHSAGLGLTIVTLRESADSALRQGAQRLATLADADDVTAAHGLTFAGVQHPCFGNHKFATCRTKVVDLELRSDNCRAQSTATGEGQGVVCGIREDAAVNEPVLLTEPVGDCDSQLNLPCAEPGDLGAEQCTERLSRENLTSQG